MGWFSKPAEWLSVSYEDEIIHTADHPHCDDPSCPCRSDEDTSESMPVPWQALSAHCAWCGDPPDRNGSHSICEYHAEQVAQQSAARQSRRRR